MAAFPVLAHQHLRILSLYSQHPLSAHRALCVGQVVMAERTLTCLNLADQFLGISPDVLHERASFQASLCNARQLHLPVRCQLRLLQVLRHQLQELPGLGREADILAPLFKQKAGKQFFYYIRPGGNGSQTAGLPQGLCHGLILCFHVRHRIFHGGEQGCLIKRGRRFCLTLCHLKGQAI